MILKEVGEEKKEQKQNQKQKLLNGQLSQTESRTKAY